MFKTVFFSCLFFLYSFYNIAQKKTERPFKCGNYVGSYDELKSQYIDVFRYARVQKGEVVASVGSSSGVYEVVISCFVDSINWTLQDIDSSCLNYSELEKVRKYFNSLSKKNETCTYQIIYGDLSKTNLPRKNYDRILILNVLHEIGNKSSFLQDVQGALKENGTIVVYEGMANFFIRKHRDCGHQRLKQKELMKEMKSIGFKLVNKKVTNSRDKLRTVDEIFYYFKKN